MKELDRLKDDFLSTISHELRTPLASIRSFSEILADGEALDRNSALRYHAIIGSETQRLTRLLDSILDLTRLEQGQADWRMLAIDPATTLEDAVAVAEGLFSDAGVALETRIEPSGRLLHADRDRLIQVFINLLSNAAKFCDPDNGRVTVSGRPYEEGYLIEVGDNGEGITPADQALIFEKFAKARERNTGRPSGSGLGLTISRHIVEHHGGSIWIRSPAGEGATFCVYLPGIGAADRQTVTMAPAVAALD